MRLLVIGGCGFVGSNFVRYVLQHYGPEMITNVDNLNTGRLANLEGVAESFGDRYEFLHSDVADVDRLEAVLAKHQFFAVVHAAASGCPTAATAALLERARHHAIRRFLLVSAERGGEALAAVEKLALEAHRDYGQEVLITRATETYGPFQSSDALIPSVIRHALHDEPISIDGDGSRVRDWMHVEDHCAGLFTALLDGRPGAIYGLRSGQQLGDLDLVYGILEQLGKGRDLVRMDAALEAPTTGLAGETATSAESLSWKARCSTEASLCETVEWYVRNREWWEAEEPA